MGRAFELSALGLFAGAVAASAFGCASLGLGSSENLGWLGSRESHAVGRAGAVRVRWSRNLGRELETSSYLPVEYASPVVDPAHDRLFVGAENGLFWAFNSGGGPLWRYEAGGSIEASPALDAEANEIYVGTSEGTLHALSASDGAIRWRRDTQGAVRNAPVLTADAVYVVMATDAVAAFRRADGETLWTYRRDPTDAFAITGHAGLAVTGSTVLAAFTDGTVVGLDASDGRVKWERDTSVDRDDAPEANARFLDVDTTPCVVGERAYVASLTAGIYALSVEDGDVIWRNAEMTGITSITQASDDLLILASENELRAWNLATEQTVWQRAVDRGAPCAPVVTHGMVLVGESAGAFLVLSLVDGHERGRVDSGRGFSSPPAVFDRLGFVLTNGASLLGFVLGS